MNDSRMNKTLIVSLVSNQTIPNVQFAKWYRSENPELSADLVFISTPTMEKYKKTRLILDALECSDFPYEAHGIIEVDENSLVDIRNKMKSGFENSDINLKSYVKIILNMTGGTKIMALAAFQFFSRFENVEIYYQSLDQKLFQVFPEEKVIPVSSYVSLVEFLVANDFSAEETGKQFMNYEFNKRFYEDCLEKNKLGLPLIQKLGCSKNFDGTFSIPGMRGLAKPEEVKQAIRIAEFCKFSPERITGAQVRYITGGWFEEYVFQHIMEEQKIPDDNIALSLKIEHGDDKNELDVVYIDSRNTLHIVECKSHSQKENSSAIINAAIYKLKSLTTKFGLKVQGHIYTKVKHINEICLSKADDLGIEIVDGNKI